MQAIVGSFDLLLGARLCPGKSAMGTVGPLTWRSFRLLGEFGFIVDHATLGRLLTSTADLDNAPQAERVAAAWCASWKEPDEPEQVAAEQLVDETAPTYAIVNGADFDLALGERAEAPAPVPVPAGPLVLCGWRVEWRDGADDEVALWNDATGEAGPKFPGVTPKAALDAAAIWALQHPCDGVPAVAFDDSNPVAAGHFIHDDGEDPADAAVGECTHEFDGGACRLCGVDAGPYEPLDIDIVALPDALDRSSVASSEAPKIPYDHPQDVAGWAFSVHPYPDTVQVVLTDAETGYDEEAFHGASEADALAKAREWAAEHPTPTEQRRLARAAAYAAADEYIALGEELAALKLRAKAIKRRRDVLADINARKTVETTCP